MWHCIFATPLLLNESTMVFYIAILNALNAVMKHTENLMQLIPFNQCFANQQKNSSTFIVIIDSDSRSRSYSIFLLFIGAIDIAHK